MRAAAFLAIAYGVLAGLLAGFLLWRRRNGRGGEAAAVRLEPASFAVFWWLIPVLLLYGLTLATRLSLFHDRFVIYALPALYLLVGMAVTSMPWPPLRALTVAALAGLLAVQTVTYAVVPVRQGYLQAARHIEAHADAGDPVIRHLYYTQILLEYSLDHTGLVLRESNSYDELLQKTVAQVENQGDVWVVLLSQPELTGGPPEREGLAQRFAEDLRQRGIPFDRQRYVGMQNLYVFHCRPADTPPNQSGGSNVPTSKLPGGRERPRAPAHASRRRNRRKN